MPLIAMSFGALDQAGLSSQQDQFEAERQIASSDVNSMLLCGC
jgi:hypothetical protein